MRAISKTLATQQQKVSYHGLTVTVPMAADYIAADRNGRLYWFAEQPHMNNSILAWTGGGTSGYLGEVNLEGMDWHETLQSIPYGGTR
jgi:hypothetical protein